MGYCPTVCIVKPGQLIHINKGRLHAFRKMSISPLPDDDCHKDLREALIEDLDSRIRGREKDIFLVLFFFSDFLGGRSWRGSIIRTYPATGRFFLDFWRGHE